MGNQELIHEFSELLALADVQLNGARDFDLQVRDERFFARVLRDGSLGFGESYMDGWWDSAALDEMMFRIFRADLSGKIKVSWKLIWHAVKSKMVNRQGRRRAFEVGEKHYDLGNELYEKMLDKRMVYTCGYWKEARNLDEAQEAKLDLVCRKIGLKAGQKVLDIGCGWGSFAKFAAEKYGAHVVGITISKEQLLLGKKLCEGLPVELRLQDYREVDEVFDHVISLGMFEHVGPKNYREYMRVVARNLQDDGLFLLHTIGTNISVQHTDPWLDRYIFPNAVLPSAAQITRVAEGIFMLEDWHNFGPYYDLTLLAWYENFEKSWPELKASGKYDERFYRMWRFYLLACAGTFRARTNQLWQIVFSKRGARNLYQSVR